MCVSAWIGPSTNQGFGVQPERQPCRGEQPGWDPATEGELQNKEDLGELHMGPQLSFQLAPSTPTLNISASIEISSLFPS